MSHFFSAIFSGYISFLAVLFLIGITGSAIVLLLSFFEDAKVILGFEEPEVKAKRDAAAATYRAQTAV